MRLHKVASLGVSLAVIAPLSTGISAYAAGPVIRYGYDGSGNLTSVTYDPVTGTLATDGTATSFQSPLVGQAGRYTFTGNAGDLLGLGVTALTITPSGGSVSFYVYKPDGTTLWWDSVPSSTSWQLPQLPVTGTYTLSVRPPGTATASMTLLLSKPLMGTIATDGTATTYQTTTAGQSGRYTFNGTAGQRFTMRATAGSGLASSIAVNVYQPNGGNVGSAYLYSNTDTKIDLGALPASGAYTVTVIPSGVTTGTVNLRVFPYDTGTLTVGTPVPFTLSSAQNGWYTFAGNAGDFLGLAVSALATTPSNGSVSFTIYKADGSRLWGSSSSYPTSWQLPQLPTTGAYSLVVQPTGTSAASGTFLLSLAAVGTISTDGTPIQFQNSSPGQSARYTFTGTLGQYFTMQATTGPGLASSISVAVFQPSGASIGSANLSSNNDTKIDLGALPATGTYTVTVIPNGVTTGTVSLRVVPYDAGTLTVGNSSSLTLGAAQNGRYTFSGNSGGLLNLAVNTVTTTPAGAYVYLSVYKPDGSALWSSGTYSPGTWQLPQLPTTGAYALVVRPYGTAAAGLTAQLTTR
jgi:hypothetical protein